uniref:Putative pectin methylesterase LuPME1 n=1 Tax=Linum usitatissimum TaxID=4006 RepID=Q94FS6_LINUS|nr:putative pectin methylesterase LuPME1 [Linum usitatissimum]
MSTFSHATTIPLIFVLLITTTSSTPTSSSSLHFSKSSRIILVEQTRKRALFEDSIMSTLAQAQSVLSSATALAMASTTQHDDGPSDPSDIKTAVVGPTHDCLDLLEDTLEQLSNVAYQGHHDPTDVQTWLSAALTNQVTCKESLLLTKQSHHNKATILLETLAHNMTRTLGNSLALYVNHVMNDKYYNYPSSSRPVGGGGRKLLLTEDDNKFPAWLPAAKRKLLEASVGELEPHAVVAKDGSGTHTSIAEAVRDVTAAAAVGTMAGGGGGGSGVIYVKAGTYKENLNFKTKQKNVVLVGDGKGKTVIVGSRNADDGSTTYDSATVAAMGDGFMARDLTIVNSAGPSKHQAVALRVGSDRAVIFRCSIQGYQDTLYTLSKRQFYRETDIYGTVDLIFGNSAVVFQNCNIYTRSGSRGDNFITAQGRTDPNQNTGISIHNCRIESDGSGAKTYLGRPWKEYSRTVVMQSVIGGHVASAGWAPWSGGFALKTLYYAEYMNSGPGAGISGRVSWPGYKGAVGPLEAGKFTVGQLIGGNSWLPSTGVSFDAGLIGV